MTAHRLSFMRSAGKQHGELWNLLVPGSGHAHSSGAGHPYIRKTCPYEILDNGCCNWGFRFQEHGKCPVSIHMYGHTTTWTRDEQREFAGLINGIKNADETDINRLTEFRSNG